MTHNILLGVNIDHVATIRQARGTRYPDPVAAAIACEQAGADGITIHLREDRRHIQDRDVLMLQNILQTRMNLEMSIAPAIVEFATKVKPAHCALVPEKRQELTTEGGLDVANQFAKVKSACNTLLDAGIDVSLFINPDNAQIEAARECGVTTIELQTGSYADATHIDEIQHELNKISQAAQYAHTLGLIVNAGHGLHYHNVKPIAAIPIINELNIGHAIIARALLSGLATAVKDMKKLMLEARAGKI